MLMRRTRWMGRLLCARAAEAASRSASRGATTRSVGESFMGGFLLGNLRTDREIAERYESKITGRLQASEKTVKKTSDWEEELIAQVRIRFQASEKLQFQSVGFIGPMLYSFFSTIRQVSVHATSNSVREG